MQLGTADQLDWLATGARRDLVTVRAKKAAGAPILTLAQPGSASAVPGPFGVSWTGGLPEQRHDRATTWLRCAGPGPLSITVAAAAHPMVVTLYTGASDLNAMITSTVGGTITSSTALGPSAATATGAVVTLRLPASGQPTTIMINGTPAGPEPALYLAAIAVSAPPA